MPQNIKYCFGKKRFEITYRTQTYTDSLIKEHVQSCLESEMKATVCQWQSKEVMCGKLTKQNAPCVSLCGR